MILHDLLFSQNQLLKWTDDWYKRNWKNKGRILKKVFEKYKKAG